MAMPLYADRRLDVVVWVVAYKLEVFVFEVEQILDIRVYLHRRQLTWCAGELKVRLFEVV